MKSIKKLIGVLVLVLSLFACDEENNFQETDIQQVPIYSLTDISGGNNSAEIINIYKTLPLIIEYTSDVNASKFSSSTFTDTSTETSYEFSVAKLIDEGEPVGYWIEGDKTTGNGTLTVVNGDVTEVFNISIEEKEVYN